MGLLGAAVGNLGGLWVGRLVESLLYGVAVTDPKTFGVVFSITVAVALAAGVPSAIRAASTDPAVSLRVE